AAAGRSGARHVMTATVVDVSALLKVIWVSLVGGLAVCTAYSLVVLGVSRGGEARRAGRIALAVPYYAAAVVGFLVCAFALWRGYAFVVDK
ncbi:MAG TPA: hypothetical protein VGI54_10390, partial [Solirubrobacteraceae bacterium]